jgi:large subunit ribosomal protein L21
MYAVIRTGGKQYRVAKDDIIKVEKLTAEAGESVDIPDVLMISGDEGTTVGAPVVDGASVSAEVVEQTRGPKIIVFKKKRRQNYRRKRGHRQDLTVLRITDINLPGAARPAKKAAAKKPAAPKAAAGGEAAGE